MWCIAYLDVWCVTFLEKIKMIVYLMCATSVRENCRDDSVDF